MGLFDIFLVIFLIGITGQHTHKQSIIYSVIAGVFFDYLFSKYIGTGFLIFYSIFIFKLIYEKFFIKDSESGYVIFVILAVILYKLLFILLIQEVANLALIKLILSIIGNLFIYYMIETFIVRHKVVISQT
jgi:cell shape-determining protein MreD